MRVSATGSNHSGSRPKCLRQLGKSLGVTFQQIQKYENGKNRLSGSRVIKAAETLRVSPAQLLGAKGSGKADGEFDALAEPAVNIMVREMKKLPLHQRRAAARAMTDLIEAFVLKR
jgi:transcriptional regulator with XRE-family HTH domain